MIDQSQIDSFKQLTDNAPQGCKQFISNNQPLFSLIQILPITQYQRDLLQATIEGTIITAYLTGALDKSKELIEWAKSKE